MGIQLVARSALAAMAIGLTMGGCSTLQPDAHLAAFSTQLTGMNEVPPVATPATGRADAVLDKKTNLLRWKVSFTGMVGAVTAAHFHGPAAVGANAGVAVPIPGPIKSPLEGSATLTAVQTADLLAGKWYVNIHSVAHPGGEIRGQLILR